MPDISSRTFVDVRERARDLALGDVEDLAILPVRFGESSQTPTIDQESTTLRKLLREAGVNPQVLGESAGAETSILKSADWIAPTLFVGAGIWSQNPLAVDVAVNVMGAYATDLLKRTKTSSTVKLSVAVESKKGKQTKLLTYEGPVDGLIAIVDAVRRVADE